MTLAKVELFIVLNKEKIWKLEQVLNAFVKTVKLLKEKVQTVWFVS